MPDLTSLLLNAFDQGREMGHLQQRKREQMKCVDTIRCGSGHDKHLFTFIRRCKVSGETKGASIKSPGVLRTKRWEEQKNGFTTIPAKLTEPPGYPHREMKQKSGREGQQDGAVGKSGCSTDDLSLISRTHKVEGGKERTNSPKLSSDFNGTHAHASAHTCITTQTL